MPMIEPGAAAAVAWAAPMPQASAATPDRIYITGHSSGAHLGGLRVFVTDWGEGFRPSRATPVKGRQRSVLPADALKPRPRFGRSGGTY